MSRVFKTTLMHGRLLQTMACYDEINLFNCASAEMASRTIQMAEEKYRDRLLGSLGEEDGERHLAHGASGTKGNLCVSPALQKFIAEEMAKEAAVLKDRRAAQEEGSLARPTKKWKGAEATS